MGNPDDWHDLAKRCRLFPLPDLVLFPHAILPLHIFEPRYRQMTEDALAADQLVTIVQIRPQPEGGRWTEPVPIMDVGCLGKIIQHERLPDGRFHFLLLGCARVRLDREVPSEKPYRIAEATVLDDREDEETVPVRRRQLIDLFLRVLPRTGPLDPGIAQVLGSDVPLGVLSDIIAHALEIPTMIKQALLAEPEVDRRVATLLNILPKLRAREGPSPRYPLPFSSN